MAPSLEAYEDVVDNLPINTSSKANDKSPESTLALEESEKHDKVLRVFRCLIADLCEQFKGGHPGGAMSMAAIGVALWKYVMKYSPLEPDYFNRDRFVLSNGKKPVAFKEWRKWLTLPVQDIHAYSSILFSILLDTRL